MKLSNQPPKGTADWFPAEFKVRKYIFDIWRKVCARYGYEEYLSPLVESAEIYRAKSGEDVGSKELVTFTDLGGRELSIRPEMTPSVTRMVSQIYDAAAKPIRYFSIANFMRNEKPQRGRNREFWQLNCDIFGSDSPKADLEILQIALDIMLEFDPPKNSFELGLSHRQILNEVLDLTVTASSPEQKLKIVRLLDKWEKIGSQSLRQSLTEIGVSEGGANRLIDFISLNNLNALDASFPELSKSSAVAEIKEAINFLENVGYGDYVKFKPSVIRGFDYYDGLVFEIFDKHPDNKRALFGGGRYNGLAEIFGAKSFPAVGFAPGDETIKLFLESWKLIDEIKENSGVETYYFPLLDESLYTETIKLAEALRQQDLMVEVGVETQKITKALDYANKKGLAKVIIFGSAEATDGVYKIKDMKTGKEKEFPLKFKK
jgi:histidyl-tRNA synthetase